MLKHSIGAIYALGILNGITVEKIALLTVNASDMSTEIKVATVILSCHRSYVLLVIYANVPMTQFE